MDAFTLPDGGNSGGNRARHHGGAAGSASAPAPGDDGGIGRQQRRWDQGHGWGDGWVVDSRGEQEDALPGAAAAAAAAPTALPVAPRHGSLATSRWGGPPPPHALSSSGAVVGAGGMAGLGRGRGRSIGGCGRGQQGQPCVRSTAATGSRAGCGGNGVAPNGVLDRRYRSMHGGGGCVGDGPGPRAGVLGEPTSRLGKRQGYAGRGQGDDPADTVVAASSFSPMHQPARDAMGVRSAWGRGGDGVGDGRSSRDVLSTGGAASPWDEEEDGGSGGGGGGDDGKLEGEDAEGALLFTGSDDGTAKAWDAASGRLVRVYAGHTRGVTCLQAAFTEVRYCVEKLHVVSGSDPHAPGEREGVPQGCLLWGLKRWFDV